ncbi:hypothetical protein [Gordonia sp. 'Campus']|nr:hypothetical protein [Gordonia sp. 'Campus']
MNEQQSADTTPPQPPLVRLRHRASGTILTVDEQTAAAYEGGAYERITES